MIERALKAPKTKLNMPRHHMCPNCMELGEWDDPQGGTALGPSVLVWCPSHPTTYSLKFNSFLGAAGEEILAEFRYGDSIMFSSTAPKDRLSTLDDFVWISAGQGGRKYSSTAGVTEAAKRAIALGMMEKNR